MNRALLTGLLLLLLLPWVAHPQVAQPVGGPAARQFLFVVEQSSAMKHRRQITSATVFQLLATGAYGAMHRGDIYRVWTFDRQVHDQIFAPRVWQPEISQALAATATKFLEEQKHSWTTKLDPAVARVVEVAKSGVPLTVFLITDGTEVLFGTPFDLEVSTILLQHADRMAKEKRPFVITLVARDGKIGGWAVDAGGGRITVPVVAEAPPVKPALAEPAPPKPVVELKVEPAPTEIAKPTVTSAKPSMKVSKPVASQPPKVVAESKPAPASVPVRPPAKVVVQTPAPAAPPSVEPPKAVSSTTTVEAVEPSKPTPPAPAPVPVVQVPPQPAPAPRPQPVDVKEPTAVQAPPLAVPPAGEKPAPMVAQPAPAAVAPKVVAVEPVVKSTAEGARAATPPAPKAVEPGPKPVPAPASPAGQTAMVVPAESAAAGVRFVLLGGGLLVVAVILVAILLRRARAVSQPSLISQSLDRERKP